MNKGMKKVVLSVSVALVVLVVTVGVYPLALLMGASEPAAAAVAAAACTLAAVAVAAVATFVVAFATAARAAFVVAFALTATFVVAFALTATFVVAEQEHIRFRWVALAYMVEGLATGNLGRAYSGEYGLERRDHTW